MLKITDKDGNELPNELKEAIETYVYWYADFLDIDVDGHRNFHIKIYMSNIYKSNGKKGVSHSDFPDEKNCTIHIALYGDWTGSLAFNMSLAKMWIRGDLMSVDANHLRWKGKVEPISYEHPSSFEAQKMEDELILKMNKITWDHARENPEIMYDK